MMMLYIIIMDCIANFVIHFAKFRYVFVLHIFFAAICSTTPLFFRLGSSTVARCIPTRTNSDK